MIFFIYLIGFAVITFLVVLLFTNPAMFVTGIVKWTFTLAGIAMVFITVSAGQQLGVAWAIVSAAIAIALFGIVALVKKLEQRIE